MFTTKYLLSKKIPTFSDSEELHLIKWRLLVCWCVSEIRNCNYNCENSAVPLGTGGEAGPADTGTLGTQRHLSRQIDNCNLLISVHHLLSNLLSKNSIFWLRKQPNKS